MSSVQSHIEVLQSSLTHLKSKLAVSVKLYSLQLIGYYTLTYDDLVYHIDGITELFEEPDSDMREKLMNIWSDIDYLETLILGVETSNDISIRNMINNDMSKFNNKGIVMILTQLLHDL